uniref:HSF-type DNA-binding domain-containing protein n=1 Tax=Leptocylindrus danicus TaxID=163516 RepID=A0A7S2K903_9STRA|mmetsp:Transcript_19964/g.29745  ORF Transcript_19964/g.29745 Transcript_19964/m.29745 type:complete len:629 (+) Transcript_19964:410-2296(+)|eukprot:CAMPEP_0116034016 /NCGR_PEP_ID=MMETSP0321-20121206/19341_1 /TAXON_ID=163516 /ORGANISM="Leptocylindrus danicus var. danicus, Strain B650" /LENGTH=628 /DNA_ID=CAMNT_0003510217 /DNA_START=409 /DNA_END=2295 /DNA_ORIENTATION=+
MSSDHNTGGLLEKHPLDCEGHSTRPAGSGNEKEDGTHNSDRSRGGGVNNADVRARALPMDSSNRGSAIPLSINVPVEAVNVNVVQSALDNLGHAEKIPAGLSAHARAVYEGGNISPPDDAEQVKLQGHVVATSKSRCYRDYSQVANADPFRPLLAPNKHLTFPLKMHIMLSHTEFEDIVSWLPHGRAWRILKTKAFSEKVLPLLFRECKYSSFIRQVNGWGFQRLTQGVDRNSYFHELFLRGLPHLTKHMNRPSLSEKVKFDPDDEPDFYKISEKYPLPANLPEQRLGKSFGAATAAAASGPSSHDAKAAASLGPIPGDAEDSKVPAYALTNGAVPGLSHINAGLDASIGNLSGLQGLQGLKNASDTFGLRSVGVEQPSRILPVGNRYGTLSQEMMHGLQGTVGGIGIDAHDPQAMLLQRVLLQDQLLRQARFERSQLERAVLLNLALAGGNGGGNADTSVLANSGVAPASGATSAYAGLGGAVVGRDNPDLSVLNPGLLQALQQHQLIQQTQSMNVGGLLNGVPHADNSFSMSTLADVSRQQQIQGLSTQGLFDAGTAFGSRSLVGDQLSQINQLQGSVLPSIGGANGHLMQRGSSELGQGAGSNPYLSLQSLQQYPPQHGNNKPPL